MLLCTDTFLARHRYRIDVVAPGLDVVVLAADGTISDRDRARVTMAFFSKDAWPDRASAFFEVARTAPRLRWFHTMSAGVDGSMFGSFRDRGVIVTRSAGASAPAMAETVFMFLHALARGVRDLAEQYETRTWRWTEWRQLEGRSIAVLGYGPVGRRVVDLAGAYGMAPTIVRRRVRGDEPCPARPVAELIGVAASADVVVVAVPLTEHTHGLVSRDVIMAMPPGALLINVARGQIVDQGALVDALRSGHLGGAGLDVFESEPLDRSSPLWDMSNVIITPHNSGSSDRSADRVIEIFFAYLRRFLDDPAQLLADAS